MGSTLAVFNDVVTNTGPVFLRSARDVVNEAQLRSYVLRRMIRGKGVKELLKGGSEIRDSIFFEEGETFQTYDSGDATFTWKNPQTLDQWTVPWRFVVDHMSWTEDEIELQIPEGLKRDARFQVYKDVIHQKERRMWTSMFNGMEKLMWGVPNKERMEDTDANPGKVPYSIFAYINEQTNGLFNSDTGGSINGTAWTTVEGLANGTIPKWRPQNVSYDGTLVSSLGDTPVAGATNIIDAFDEMWLKVKWQAPPSRQEYFESPDMYAMAIYCSQFGQNTFRRLLRASQDQYVTPGRQDPSYNRPQYAGIDVEYIESLDTAAVYAADTATDALVTERAGAAVAEDNGPRFYWVHGKYIKPVFHTRRYMYKHEVMRHPNQPFTFITPCNTYYNLVARSLQRHGIVRPSGDVYA